MENMQNGKRKIIVGIDSPDEKEGNTIYVTLRQAGPGAIMAMARSNTPFNFNTYVGEKSVSQSRTSGSNIQGIAPNTSLRPYQKFVRELVQQNDGDLDYSQLSNPDLKFQDIGAAKNALDSLVR